MRNQCQNELITEGYPENKTWSQFSSPESSAYSFITQGGKKQKAKKNRWIKL